MKKAILISFILLRTLFCYSQTEIGNTLKFDGIDDYIEFDISGGLSEENFTLEFWVKVPSDNSNQNMSLFSIYNCGQGFNIYLNKNGFPEFVWSTNENKNTTTSIINIKDNKWHHLAFVRSKESNTLKIAIDGSQAGTRSTEFSGYNIPYKTSKLIFGTNLEIADFGNSFSGIIDDLFIWNRALTNAEIKSKSSCTAILTLGVKDIFHFNQGNPSGINNIITNVNGESGNIGVLKNFSLSGDTSNWIASDLTCTIEENTETIDYGALNFDGINDGVEVRFSDAIYNYNDEVLHRSKTVTTWVKIPIPGTNNLEIDEEVGIIISSEEFVKYSINKEGKANVYWNRLQLFSGNTDLRDNKWHHIAFVRNMAEGKFIIYIDGEEDAVFNDAEYDIHDRTRIRIGRGTHGGIGRFHGTIDNIRIWEQYLTKEKINAYMHTDFTGNPPEEKYMNISFNLGVKPVTEILEPLYSENGNVYTLNNFSLFGSVSNFVEGRKGNVQVNNFDIIQDRLNSGETPHDVIKSIENPEDLYGKIYQGDIIFYFDTSHKSVSLVKQSHIGKFAWGVKNTGNSDQIAAVAEVEKNRKVKDYGIIGSAYETTRNTIRYNTLKSTENLAYINYAPYKAITHLSMDKKYFLPSLSDMWAIHKHITEGEGGLNSTNFDYNFWTAESASANSVETYNIAKGTRALLEKNQSAFVLPIRVIDEGSYDLEEPPYKIETDRGTFQNIGNGQWVFTKSGKFEAIYFEDLLDNNKLILKTSEEYNSFEYESSRYNQLTIYFNTKTGNLSENGSSIFKFCNVTKLERDPPNKYLKEALEFNTVGAYQMFIENNNDILLKELALRSIFSLLPSIENYKIYLKNFPNGEWTTNDIPYKFNVKRILDDLLWELALTKDTIEGYQEYINGGDGIYTPYYITKAENKIREYEYVIMVKLDRIYVDKMDDGIDAGGELELLWKLTMNNNIVIDNTYDVERDYDTPANYIAQPAFDLGEGYEQKNVRNGRIWNTISLRDNSPLAIDVHLYDEDGDREYQGNIGTDDLGSQRLLVYGSELRRNTPTRYNLIIEDEDKDNIVEVTLELIKLSREEYAEHLRVNIDKCSARSSKNYTTAPKDGPGFLIRNETDFDLDVSLNQVGPLYYDIVKPGETFYRKTGAVWFTIEASINVDGEQKYNTWDCIAPALKFSIEVLSAAYSGYSLARGGVAATYQSANRFSKVVKAAKNVSSAVQNTKVWKAYKTFSDFQDFLGGGNVGKLIETSEDIANFAADQFSEEVTFVSEGGCYAGWYGSKIKVYTITGGPKAPCVDDEGTVAIPPSEPLKINGPFKNEGD